MSLDLLLFQLQSLISTVCNVHGTAFKVKLYKRILDCLEQLAPVTRISFPCLFSTLTAFPSYLSCPNGALHAPICDWVFAKEEEGAEHLLHAALQVLEETFSETPTLEANNIQSDFKVPLLPQ